MFLPHTFRGGGYDVTVNADRSIKIRQGDWLSKYSMAIYGNFEHTDKFMEKNTDKSMEKKRGEFRPVGNPNLIRAGNILYHPDRLPGESKILPGDGGPGTPAPIQANYVWEFLTWVYNRFQNSDWCVKGTGGGDLSLSILTGQYETIRVVKKSEQVEAWLHALAFGVTIGWPEDIFVGGSFSTVAMPDFGTIRKAPWHRELTLEDFQHGIIVLEFGTNFFYVVGGFNLSLLFFGIAVPPWQVLKSIRSYLRFGYPSLDSLFLKWLPSGVMFLAGATIGIPNLGLAGRGGLMYDRSYIGV